MHHQVGAQGDHKLPLGVMLAWAKAKRTIHHMGKQMAIRVVLIPAKNGNVFPWLALDEEKAVGTFPMDLLGIDANAALKTFCEAFQVTDDDDGIDMAAMLNFQMSTISQESRNAQLLSAYDCKSMKPNLDTKPFWLDPRIMACLLETRQLPVDCDLAWFPFEQAADVRHDRFIKEWEKGGSIDPEGIWQVDHGKFILIMELAPFQAKPNGPLYAHDVVLKCFRIEGLTADTGHFTPTNIITKLTPRWDEGKFYLGPYRFESGLYAINQGLPSTQCTKHPQYIVSCSST